MFHIITSYIVTSGTLSTILGFIDTIIGNRLKFERFATLSKFLLHFSLVNFVIDVLTERK